MDSGKGGFKVLLLRPIVNLKHYQDNNNGNGNGNGNGTSVKKAVKDFERGEPGCPLACSIANLGSSLEQNDKENTTYIDRSFSSGWFTSHSFRTFTQSLRFQVVKGRQNPTRKHS